VVWWFGGSLARVIVFFLLVGTFAETLRRGLVLAGLFTLLRRGWWVEALSNVGGERKNAGLSVRRPALVYLEGQAWK
jgi:hypothetical protein